MAAEKKKTGRKKTGKNKGKLLSASKVERILIEMEVDVAAFKKRYEENTSRGGGMRTPTPEQIAAVEQFQKTGDMEKLKAALNTKNQQTANAAVARVTGWQSKQ